MSVIGTRPLTSFEKGQEAYLEQLRISNRMKAEKRKLDNEKTLSDYIAYGPSASDII